MELTYYKKNGNSMSYHSFYLEVPARIELASKEPESFILSIKLWDQILIPYISIYYILKE